MNEEALIIFVRKPELGKVKTRIAAAIGDKAALAIYRKLLQHTHAVTSFLPCDKFVFYVDAIEEDDMWSNGYHKQVQATAGLGERMNEAFAFLFENGYRHVCIVGSDCFELTPAVIQQAFSLLNSNDLVVGPANDGGYYLLGMSDGVKDVFEGIAWSTENVLKQTKEKMEQHHYSYALLPMLNDVDTADDVPDAILSELEVMR